VAKNKETFQITCRSKLAHGRLKYFSYFFNLRALLAEAAKKRLNKGFFNCDNFPGAEVWLSPALSLSLFQCCSSGPGGWAAVPEKSTSVFINTTQGRSRERKRLVKGFLIGATSQGRRLGSAGALGCSAPVPEK
jgi:hypothetical protein